VAIKAPCLSGMTYGLGLTGQSHAQPITRSRLGIWSGLCWGEAANAASCCRCRHSCPCGHSLLCFPLDAQVRWFPREVIATKADSRKRYRHAVSGNTQHSKHVDPCRPSCWTQVAQYFRRTSLIVHLQVFHPPPHTQGMLQMFPDGTPGFHHRTADVKFFPWCCKCTVALVCCSRFPSFYANCVPRLARCFAPSCPPGKSCSPTMFLLCWVISLSGTCWDPLLAHTDTFPPSFACLLTACSEGHQEW
jgi:hypothetical protein